jgi:lipid-binding SYLF domain-containing protein
MIKFALGVSITVNALLIGVGAAAVLGAHSTEGATVINLYLKKRGYLAERG